MKDEETRNWAELPPELTSSILHRLGPVEILENAEKVCKSWRRVCKDPSMWRKIDLSTMVYDIESLCRRAVDRSEGGLVEINIRIRVTDSLLVYIADRSSNLRCLRISMLDSLKIEGLVNAVRKLPFLEVLDISYYHAPLNLKAIGRSCPSLKTLILNRVGGVWNSNSKCDDDDALAIAETMPKLSHLELGWNRLTNTGLNAILENCPHLKHFGLHQCLNVNLVGDMEKRCSERSQDRR